MPFTHGPTLRIPLLLLAALPAPPLQAELAVQASPHWLGPGGSALLQTRWTGTGNQPALTWSLPGAGEGLLLPRPDGGCLYQAPHWLAQPLLVRVRAAWAENGGTRHRDVILQVRAGCSGLGGAMAYVPHLPGSKLHERWIVADRTGQQILILDGKGHAEPWLGALDPGAAARDGKGGEARFQEAAALVARPVEPGQEDAWEAFIVDRGAHALRRVDAKGEVTTLAGALGQAGHRDGSAAEARFDRPGGVACGPGGQVFVADTGNRCLRRIGPSGVATVAGAPGSGGFQDGLGAAAELVAPGALCLDAESKLLFFADGPSLRTLDPEARVRTVAGGPEPCGPDGPAMEGRAAALERMAGIPCLGDPAALAVAGSDLRICDRGRGRLLTLRIRGNGADLGRLRQAPDGGGSLEAKEGLESPATSVQGAPAESERAELLTAIARAERGRAAGMEPARTLPPVTESPEARTQTSPGRLEAKDGKSASGLAPSLARVLPETRWLELARRQPPAPRTGALPPRSHSWSEASGRPGPVQPALPRRHSVDLSSPGPSAKRLVPVQDPRNRAILENALELFADGSFARSFHQAMYRHSLNPASNDHLAGEEGPISGRYRRLLDRYGARGLDGRFFLKSATVCDLAEWMLRNPDLANTTADLEGWRRKGCPRLPEFPFALLIQDRPEGKENRIVLDVPDFRKLKAELQSRPGGPGHKAALEELEAGGFVTGFSAQSGQPVHPTRGLRLVLFEGGERVATCHPLGPDPGPWFQPRSSGKAVS